jgi:hypothetical protein
VLVVVYVVVLQCSAATVTMMVMMVGEETLLKLRRVVVVCYGSRDRIAAHLSLCLVEVPDRHADNNAAKVVRVQ